jgi:hypothetical protein
MSSPFHASAPMNLGDNPTGGDNPSGDDPSGMTSSEGEYASAPSEEDHVPQQSPQQAPPPQVEQPAQNNNIPGDIQKVLSVYQDVVKNPENVDALWKFVSFYLTFLESHANKLVPILKNFYPDVKENNIILILKEISSKEVAWGVYNVFFTISNIGSEIAKNPKPEPSDQWYIVYVMLSLTENSPVYDFSILLQKLQEQNEKTAEVYRELNNRFLTSFAKYENVGNTPEVVIENVDVPFLERSITIPLIKKTVHYKLLLALLIIIALILLAVFGYRHRTKISQRVTQPVNFNKPRMAVYSSDISVGS